jgi:hypothetical protein
MKRILGVVAILATTSVCATELKFGDLNWFLTQGRFNITADYNRVTEEETVSNVLSEADGNRVNTKFAYGLADNINVFLGLDYNFKMAVKTEGQNKFYKNGLYNPAIGANYRAMNQDAGGFNLDFGAIVRISLDDEEIGDASGGSKENGNASKRSSLELNGRLGNKWNEANEFYTILGLVYNQSGEVTELDASGGADTDYDLDTSMDLYLGGYYQYRPVNEFMITLGSEVRRYGMTEGDINGTTDFEIKDYIDWRFTFDAKYLITETFIAKFNYVGALNSDITTDVNGASNTVRENRHYSSFGAGVDFLF